VTGARPEYSPSGLVGDTSEASAARLASASAQQCRISTRWAPRRWLGEGVSRIEDPALSTVKRSALRAFSSLVRMSSGSRAAARARSSAWAWLPASSDAAPEAQRPRASIQAQPWAEFDDAPMAWTRRGLDALFAAVVTAAPSLRRRR